MLFEVKEVCSSCRGTGLYAGIGEKEGAGVVCYECKGTGCYPFKHEYTEFKERKSRNNVKRVFSSNPGIGIGEGGKGNYHLEDFGGMPYSDWAAGKPFPKKSEMRLFTCPAWWYQSVDYDLKPGWPQCISFGSFSGCKHFSDKDRCWARWDKEEEGKI